MPKRYRKRYTHFGKTQAAMSFYDVIRDELISGVDEVMGIAAFLEATRGAQILYI